MKPVDDKSDRPKDHSTPMDVEDSLQTPLQGEV